MRSRPLSRWRRPRLPAAAKAQLTSRVLAARELDQGGWVVLTRAGIVVFGADDGGAQDPEVDRLWHEVDQGEWNGEERLIRLTWVDGADPLELVLAVEDRTLADVLHERVQASLVHLEQEKVPGGGVLRGAIRRNADGELFSQVSVKGTVTRGAALDRQVAALEARVRSAVGMSR